VQSLTVNGNGAIHYAPDANYNGDDTFGYIVSDGHGGSATGSVSYCWARAIACS
jgi:serine/threonine protein phosphatase PrpC